MKRSIQGTAGFTLVEMLAATALMGVVLAALAAVTSQWLPNWNRGFARVQQAETLYLGLDRLVRDVAAAEFVTRSRNNPAPLFEGSETAVTFVRAALGPNARFGLEVVQISETADRLGPALVRSRSPFTPVADATEPLLFADPVVVLRAPYRATFAYAGTDRVWKSAWTQSRELPSAVRFTVRDTAAGRTVLVTTATVIHNQAPAACVKSRDDPRCGRPGPNTTPEDMSTAAPTASDRER